MDIKPLVIIGNGPSIRGFDFSKLDGIDTIAVNGFFKVCQKTGWFPTMYGLFRDLWKDETIEFVKENANKMKRVFCLDTLNSGGERQFGDALDGISNVIMINRILANNVPPELQQFEWSPPYYVELQSVLDALAEKYGEDYVANLVKSKEMPDERLNFEGMIKYLTDKEEEIDDEDVLVNRRWEPDFVLPKSFSEFYTGENDSSTDCAKIGLLLGYNFFILVGNDGRFSVKDGKFVDESSWGIDGILEGKPLDIREMVKCNLCRSEKGLIEARKKLWGKFLMTSAIYQKPFIVWNCTPNSAIDNLEMHDLDETLKLLGRKK